MAAATKAVETVEEVIEEVVEELADDLQTVKRITPPRINLNGTTRKQQLVILGVTATVGGVVGATAAYLVVRKKLSKKYDLHAQKEIELARDFYKRQAKPNLRAIPDVPEEPSTDMAAEALTRYQGITDDALLAKVKDVTEEADPTPEPLKSRNIFDAPATPPGEAVGEALLRDRDPKKPYIVTKDEWYENELEFEERHFTYFAGDNVLCDESDFPIMATDEIVGTDNLHRFGYFSGSETTVYVRNEKQKLNIEIEKSEGKFALEVAGLPQDHIEHSDRPKRGHRRFDDEL